MSSDESNESSKEETNGLVTGRDIGVHIEQFRKMSIWQEAEKRKKVQEKKTKKKGN